MANILKGNYELNNGPTKSPRTKKASRNLTDHFEESALAKLGGSICFVTKGSTFVWAGDEDEESGS